MVGLLYFPTDLLFFDIPLLNYFINLNSSIICCLSSGDMYLSLGNSVSLSSASGVFCGDFFKAAILLPIKSPVAHAVFCIAFFEAVLNTSVMNCLA